MRKQVFILALLFFLGMFFIPPAGLASEAPSGITIQYSNNKISVDLVNAPLGDVLDIIHDKTGVDYQLSRDLRELKINVAFRDLDLEQGLKKILRRVNNAFIYGPERKVLKVAIFNKLEKEFPSDSYTPDTDRPVADPVSEPQVAMGTASASQKRKNNPKINPMMDPKAGPQPVASLSGAENDSATGPQPIAAAPSDEALEGPRPVGSPSISALEGPKPAPHQVEAMRLQTNPDNTPMPIPIEEPDDQPGNSL
jgi:hypothetical protein